MTQFLMGLSHARPIFNNNIKKKFEDVKWVFRSRKFKDKQQQWTKVKRTNNGGHRKLKIEQHKPQ